ncbi:MAG: MmcQ/YjbR family DNA-binding protein [Acetobacteraceae bacterium]|nr:MmcQ/YjbR family DNA-binding protein [Acetobacteraceae bacterium]
MKADEFRRIALSLPDTVEASHMGHPDFRVRGRIFATLGYPNGAWGMVKLTPEQQAVLVGAHPEMFTPVPGGWGRKGCTSVNLASADAAALGQALETAWRNVTLR